LYTVVVRHLVILTLPPSRPKACTGLHHSLCIMGANMVEVPTVSALSYVKSTIDRIISWRNVPAL